MTAESLIDPESLAKVGTVVAVAAAAAVADGRRHSGDEA
jgi:hypothetical protein